MNFQQHFTTATFTELSHDPFLWVAVVFAVIASINTVARRKHVGGDCARTLVVVKGNEVIHCEGVPQTSGATAIGTAPAPPIERELPINTIEIIRLFSLTRVVAIHDKPQFAAIVLAILAHPLALLVGICKSPRLHLLPMVGIIALACSLAFALGIQVAGAPFTARLAPIVAILGVMLTLPFSTSIYILCTPFTDLGAGATLALGAQSIGAAAFLGKEIFSRCGQFLVAFRAAFEVIHSSNYTANATLKGLQVTVT